MLLCWSQLCVVWVSQDYATLGTIADVNSNRKLLVAARVCVTSINFVCMDMDVAAVLSTFGYTRNEIIGQNVRVFVPNPFSFNHQNHLLALMASGNFVSQQRCRHD